jgi:hypothetical protein
MLSSSFIFIIVLWSYFLGSQVVLVTCTSAPTSAPTYEPKGTNYCNSFTLNDTSTSLWPSVDDACIGCLREGCAYCRIDEDDMKLNFCYSYNNPADPTYGTCGDTSQREVGSYERDEQLSTEEYESYCAATDIGALIVIVLFFYIIMPCCCAAAIVTIFVRVTRAMCFKPLTTVAPGGGGGGGDVYSHYSQHPLRRDGQPYSQPLSQPMQPSPYANLQMADAKIVNVAGGDGVGQPSTEGYNTDGQAGTGDAIEIPVVYAEAVPHHP